MVKDLKSGLTTNPACASLPTTEVFLVVASLPPFSEGEKRQPEIKKEREKRQLEIRLLFAG